MSKELRKTPPPSKGSGDGNEFDSPEKQEACGEPSVERVSREISHAVEVLANIEQFGGYLTKTAHAQATRLTEAQDVLVRTVAPARDLAGAAASVTKKIQVGSLVTGNDLHTAAQGVILLARVLRQLNGLSKTTAAAVESHTATTRALIEMVGEVARVSVSLAGKVATLAEEAPAALPALSNKNLVETELAWLTRELEKRDGRVPKRI